MSGIALHDEAKTIEASYFGEMKICGENSGENGCEPLDNPGPE